VKIVGVARAANNPVPGVRTKNLLREIAFNWRGAADVVEQAGTKEAFERSLELCRAGIVVGPSSGFAFQGLLQSLHTIKLQGFSGVRGKNKKIVAVFVCPDSPLPYLREYFSYLDEKHFSSIKNAHLLSQTMVVDERQKYSEQENQEAFVDPLKAFDEIYADDVPGLWKKLKSGASVVLKKNVKIIDVRSKEDFEHFHLPLAESYPHTEVLRLPKKSLKNKKVFLVCPMGIKTKAIATLLRKKGVEAYSILGGLTAWSELDLPRWRPDVCIVHHR
jgi:cysteine synthase A